MNAQLHSDRRVGWVVGSIDIVAWKKSMHYIRGMDFLLEYRIAECDISLLQDSEKLWK